MQIKNDGSITLVYNPLFSSRDELLGRNSTRECTQEAVKEMILLAFEQLVEIDCINEK